MKRKRTGGTPAQKLKKVKTAPRTAAAVQALRLFEFKNFDAVNANRIVAAQTTATVVSIFNADQGTAPNEHVGRSVKVASLEYNFQVSAAATTAGASAIRLAIVYDRQPNAALPTTTDVWVTDEIETMKNRNNKKRFKILVDQKLEGISATAGPASLYNSGYRRFRVPLETEYNNTNGGTIADITTGSYVAFVWQVGTLITAAPDAVLFTRIMYTDG